MTPDTPTPRTDANEAEFGNDYYTEGMVQASFARELEREIALLREACGDAAMHIAALMPMNLDMWASKESRSAWAQEKVSELAALAQEAQRATETGGRG